MQRGWVHVWVLCLGLLAGMPAAAQELPASTPVADRIAARREFPWLGPLVADRMVADPGLLIAVTDPRLPQLPPPKPVPGKPAAPYPEPCFKIKTVEISGIVIADRSEVLAAIAPFLQACQGNSTVRGLLLSVNAVYASKGYITTQAYLPKQDLKTSGLILIEVKPGRIERIVYEEKPAWNQGTYFERLAKSGRALFGAESLDAFFKAIDTFAETLDDPLERPLISAPWLRSGGAMVAKPGDILNLEDIQQGLDQLNRAPSSKAKSKLDPGKEPNTSVVRIANPQDDAFRVIAGTDTYGSVATGIVRRRIEIARDNLFGINDSWRSSLTTSRLTNELTTSFSVPYRWLSLSVDGKYSEALIPLGSVAELFTQTTTIGSTLGWTVNRTPDGRLDLSAGIRLYHNDRFINDIMLTPQVFTALDFGATRSFVLGQRGMLTLGAKYSVGTEMLKATIDDTDPLPTAPRAQFRKIEGTSNLQWALTDSLTLTSGLTAQFSTTPLYSPDQFTIGGMTSVRGFKAAPVVGDRGAHIRNEVGAKLPVDAMFKAMDWKSVWAASRLKALEGYVFLDGGASTDIANHKNTLLAGTGIGLRIKDSRYTADLSLARGVYQMGPVTPLATEIYLNFGWKMF
jgi:hemolysin activation/secretion protein